MKPDGTFEQEAKYSNDNTWKMDGSWTLTNQLIRLDKCYLTYDGEKQMVNIPPKLVGLCSFSWEGNAISRSELEPLWKKPP